MKYDLGDLKTIADELLDSMRVDRRLAQKISEGAVTQASVKAARRPAPKRWLMYTAASCVTCAAAAVLIVIASFSQMNQPANQLASGANATGNIQTLASPLIITADDGAGIETRGTEELMSARLDLSSAPMATYSPAAEYSVVQSGEGKWGVKADDAGWLIDPEYDSGYIEGGIAYMRSGELLHVIPLDGE